MTQKIKEPFPFPPPPPLQSTYPYGSFPFVVCAPSPQYVMHPFSPVTEDVPLHSKSLCKNIVRASGGANNMHPLSWGGGGAETEMIPLYNKSLYKNIARVLLK